MFCANVFAKKLTNQAIFARYMLFSCELSPLHYANACALRIIFVNTPMRAWGNWLINTHLAKTAKNIFGFSIHEIQESINIKVGHPRVLWTIRL